LELPLEAQLSQLGRLCDDADRLDPSNREALVAWVMVLAQCGKEDWIERLRLGAIEQGTESLARMLQRYSSALLLDDLTGKAVSLPGGRELSLGERKSLARRPNRQTLVQLLRDPHPSVIRQLLTNPHLTEADVIALLAIRPGRPKAIETLAQLPDWLARARVRMAVLHNPWTPSYVAIPLVSLLIRQELEEIADSPELHIILRATAVERIGRCPPFAPALSTTLN
jgi:hypothetical protein